MSSVTLSWARPSPVLQKAQQDRATSLFWKDAWNHFLLPPGQFFKGVSPPLYPLPPPMRTFTTGVSPSSCASSSRKPLET